MRTEENIHQIVLDHHTWDNDLARSFAEYLVESEDPDRVATAQWLMDNENREEVWQAFNMVSDILESLRLSECGVPAFFLKLGV